MSRLRRLGIRDRLGSNRKHIGRKSFTATSVDAVLDRPGKPGCGYGEEALMNRIGLSLSGGGFRATLFHLGMIRFLREANLLGSVTHITSVSGGSILAAHLVLNWKRYCGSLEEFDAAAAEVIRFVQMDV